MAAFTVFASPSALPAWSTRSFSFCPRRRPRISLASRISVPPPAACATPAGASQATTSRISTTQDIPPEDPVPNWKDSLVPGAVVEYWSNGKLCVGTVVRAHMSTVQLLDAAGTDEPPQTVSHGEIVSVWPEKADASAALQDANALLEGVNVSPGVFELFAEYSRGTRAPFTSHEASSILFPKARGSAAAAAVAAARVIAAHPARFRRAPAGTGWRAYPPSVAATRESASFIAAAREILNAPAGTAAPTWPIEQRAMLANMEVCAASGAAPPRAVGRILRELGYDATDDAAAAFLLALGHWAPTDAPRAPASLHAAEAQPRRAGARPPEWTFPPAVLDAARELRDAARARRAGLARAAVRLPRRNMSAAADAVFCIDDRSTNFLDDAVAVRLLHGGALARVFLHVADVAGLVPPGCEIDALARERGQSLYLPLRPLHMLPPPVMEAASFSASLPTEAVTVVVDFDLRAGALIRWDVFPSLVPPVVRLNYEQLDELLASRAAAVPGLFSADLARSLRLLADLAPRLAAAADRRKTRRRARDAADPAVSGVRLVRGQRRGERETRVAHVSTFREGGAHAVVADLLVTAGSVLREFARSRGVALPEDRGAAAYAMRCGTAPMRRYADLATQRQLRCVLFGLQPAGRRAMDELRVWLTKRSDAAAKTVAGSRRVALFEALADRCVRQARAAGRERAVLNGRVRNCTVSKRGVVRVLVALQGTGLVADARLSGDIMNRVQAAQNGVGRGSTSVAAGESGDEVGAAHGKLAKNEAAQRAVRKIVPVGMEVRVLIDKVDTAAQFINATVTSIAV